MLTYFINRAGKGLSPSHRAELEKSENIFFQKRIGEAQVFTEKGTENDPEVKIR